jgi:hypothetical protein
MHHIFATRMTSPCPIQQLIQPVLEEEKTQKLFVGPFFPQINQPSPHV